MISNYKMFDFTKEENRKYVNDFFFFLLKKVNDDIILKHLENLNSDEIFNLEHDLWEY